MKNDRLMGVKAVAVGMARSGRAAVELLLAAGASVRAVDQTLTGDVHGIAIEPQTGAAFEGAELVVVSPGVPADAEVLENARARGAQVIGEVELAGWFLEGDTIGITGSNGKTTTTALTGHILRAAGIPCQVGGNIGIPPTAMVSSSRAGQWNVLELSSFQLETTATFHARIGVALNVTDNHLDRHYTFARYAAAKGKLFERQTPRDFAVLNADNPATVGFARLTLGSVRWFSAGTPQPEGAWVDHGTIRLAGEALLDTREIPLPGKHNRENVMAAAIASHLAGAPPAQIAQAVRSFAGVEHRLEPVRTLNGVAFYNDSKATSVDATLKAIDAFPGGLWIILGGKDKNSDYSVLREPLRKRARAVLLIGSAADKIESALDGAAPLVRSGTLDRAVAEAARLAQPGDTVLLAPACASFDQFRSFEHRGEEFKRLVRQLPGGENGSTL